MLSGILPLVAHWQGGCHDDDDGDDDEGDYDDDDDDASDGCDNDL